MRFRCHFGLNEPPRECAWWKPIQEFPPLVKFKGTKYEFVMWGPDPTNQVDYILHFSQMATYDPNWHATVYEDIDHLFFGYGQTCECGAIYSSFPWDHMRFCRLWTKW
jgi:hypothetical protein